MKRLNLNGQRFGRLIVIALGQHKKGRHHRWLCRCECGAEKEISVGNLRNGHTQSCGCIARETSAKTMRAMNTTHGHTWDGGRRSPTYGSWRAMLYRCTSPSDSSYAKYGAMGITVCERWRKFENFLTDMGLRPDGMTLDRIDNAKGYEPSNCRWATATTQMNNRSTTKFLEFEGRRQSIGDWANEKGINFGVLAFRVKAGWTAERALTEPVRKLARS